MYILDSAWGLLWRIPLFFLPAISVKLDPPSPHIGVKKMLHFARHNNKSIQHPLYITIKPASSDCKRAETMALLQTDAHKLIMTD